MTRSLMKIPQQTRRTYANTYLSRVIVQLRFPRVPTIATSGDALYTALRADFPLAEPLDATISLPDGREVAIPRPQVHSFLTRDRGIQIDIETSAITFIATQYPGWETMAELVTQTTAKIWEICQPVYVSRVGLRYQDAIEKLGDNPPGFWRNYLQSDLLAFTANDILVDSVLASEHAIVLQDDAARINLRWSTRSGSTQGGEPIQRLDLDLDMYQDDSEFDLPDALGELDRYHDKLIQLFEWLITDTWRDEMRTT